MKIKLLVPRVLRFVEKNIAGHYDLFSILSVINNNIIIITILIGAWIFVPILKNKLFFKYLVRCAAHTCALRADSILHFLIISHPPRCIVGS